MDNNVPTTKRCGVIGIVVRTYLVIVDDCIAIIFVADLNAEGIWAAISGGWQETVIPTAVDCAHAFEFSLILPSHNQPIIAATVEVQVAYLELEFGVAIWHIGALFILGHKAESCFARQGFIGCNKTTTPRARDRERKT